MQNQTHSTQHVDSSSLQATSGVCLPSYALGPIDPDLLAPMTITLSNGKQHVFLLPDVSLLPSVVVNDPHFYEGVIAGFELPDDVFEYTHVVDFLSGLTHSFLHDLRCGGVYPWSVGFLLASLSYLAQEDALFALVGIAHVCHLMALVPWLPAHLLSRFFTDADHSHSEAVRAFRARIKAFKAQGMSFAEAQVQALAGPSVAALYAQRSTLYAPVNSILSCPCRKSQCEYPDCAMGEPEFSDICLVVEEVA